MLDPGFNISAQTDPLDWSYGEGVFGPEPENRKLDSIRKSLREPDCDGPETVYSIVMDVGKDEHLAELRERHLLYGAVTYAAGRLGNEPVRSQGHIHSISPRSGWSTPEVYEIWQGEAIILMQERATDDPGRCFAVRAKPGEVVIVPPDWAHATISANPDEPLTFGAWCDRAYGFEYDDVRAHGGLAFFPLLNDAGEIVWEKNPAYGDCELIEKLPAGYEAFGIEMGVPIYKQFEQDRGRFQFVPDPQLKAELWKNFTP